MGVVYKVEDTQVAPLCRPQVPARGLGQGSRGPRALSARSPCGPRPGPSNICTIYEIGEHEGQPFIAMQVLSGQNGGQTAGECRQASP
jgi:eukaryotic-like serine/threonine-protein kinase